VLRFLAQDGPRPTVLAIVGHEGSASEVAARRETISRLLRQSGAERVAGEA
jgi:hypothetical protein